jgi:hypothetical protein
MNTRRSKMTYEAAGGGTEDDMGMGGKGGEAKFPESSKEQPPRPAVLTGDSRTFEVGVPAAVTLAFAFFECWSDLCMRSFRSANKK